VVEELRAAVEQRADDLLDKMERGTEICDFLAEFAYPLPSTPLTRLLDRMPNLELGTRQFEYRPFYFLRALKSLPIVTRR
jgi:cytochrome P450